MNLLLKLQPLPDRLLFPNFISSRKTCVIPEKLYVAGKKHVCSASPKKGTAVSIAYAP